MNEVVSGYEVSWVIIMTAEIGRARNKKDRFNVRDMINL